MEAKFGNRRKQATAQVMAECDGLDFANSNEGYWCPILSVLTDGVFQLFVYDSSTREVFCSEQIGVLAMHVNDLNFLKSIRQGKTLPRFYCLS